MNYQHDVFISYAHIDNQPALEGQTGWIDDFHPVSYTHLPGPGHGAVPFWYQ